MTREELIEEAQEAICRVFSDTSVSQEETYQDLKELQGHIDVLLDTLNQEK